MTAHFTSWIFLTTIISIACLLSTTNSSNSEVHHQMASTTDEDDDYPAGYFTASSKSNYVPQIMRMMKKFRVNDEEVPGKIRRVPQLGGLKKKKNHEHGLEKRMFPEIDSRGFDEDIFDEGFGDWSPMKRW